MSNKKIKVNLSLIIPLKDNFDLLNHNLQKMTSWSKLPSELIIVNSSKRKYSLESAFLFFCKKKNLKVLITHVKNSFPGKSRNIGIKKATCSVLGFLDVNTIPNNQWLEKSFYLLKKSSSLIVWGSTKYIANSSEKNILAATYGFNPIQTLPGSVMYKSVFFTVGLFVENYRAGEDGDWKSRVVTHSIKSEVNKNFLTYQIKNNLRYMELLKKWHRNYISTSKLPYFVPHKNSYYYFFVFLALTWNPYIARSYQAGFYMPHLAKLSLFSLFFLYLAIRSIFLPLKKGMPILNLFPFNFIKILTISFLIDIVKISAFAKSRGHLK